MNLPDTIKAIQRHYGLDVDGVAGPETMGAIWRDINEVPDMDAHAIPGSTDMDARTAANLATLDPKARDRFTQFYNLANATAATYGCTYVLIGGNRTWEEQDALYAIGRSKPGTRVTNAKGGQSNHNFGIGGDFGVFRGKSYLDDSNPELAAKVHKACSMHAVACGLLWGGAWTSITDLPHYEVDTGLTMMAKRNLYKSKGSVL